MQTKSQEQEWMSIYEDHTATTDFVLIIIVKKAEK